MNEARLKIIGKEDSPAGMPINYSCYGEILKNSTVLLRFGTSEKMVEITCTREWALRFVKSVTEILDAQSGAEPQIPAPSSLFPAY